MARGTQQNHPQSVYRGMPTSPEPLPLPIAVFSAQAICDRCRWAGCRQAETWNNLQIKSFHLIATSYPIISYHLTLRQITSHHLTSHPIRITSHHVTSRHITSHHITSHNCGQHWLYTMCIREALQCQEAAPKTRSEMSAAKPPAHHTRLADAPWVQPGAAERREAK